MTVPSFLQGAEPIRRQEKPSFLEGAQPLKRVVPEESLVRTYGVQPAAGGASGFLGSPGSIVDLLGLGLTWVGNKITGSEVDYGEIREQVKQGNLPGAQERRQREFDALERLNNPEKRGGFWQTWADIDALGSDDLAPEPYVLPNIQEVGEAIDTATGGFTAPKTANERIARQAGEFVGATAFPIGGQAKGTQLAGAALGGAMAGAARERGATPLEELGFAIGGSVLGGAGTRTAQAIPKTVSRAAQEGVKQTAARALSKFPFVRVNTKQINRDVLQAAKAEGVDLPISALTENPVLRMVEAQLAESSLAGNALDKARRTMAKQYVDSVKRMFKGVSETAYENNLDAGNALQDSLKRAEKIAEETYRNMYDTAINDIPRSDKIALPKIAEKSDILIDKLSQTIKPSTEEAKTLSIIKDLRSEIVDEAGNLKPIEARKLVGYKRSLSDTIDIEAQGGSRKLLKSLLADTKEQIEDYGRKNNPQFYKKYKEAEKYFAEAAESFRNKDIRNALRQQTPENLIKQGSNVSTIDKYERALNYLPEGAGKEAYDAFRRAKLENSIRDKLISPKDRSARYKVASNIFNDRDKASVIQKLAGKEGFQKLKNLQKIAEGITEGAEKFANPSKSGVKLVEITTYLAILRQVAKAMSTGDPVALATIVTAAKAPSFLANIISDRKFIDEMIRLAQAGKGKSSANYYRALEQATQSLRAKLQQFEGREERPSQ